MTLFADLTPQQRALVDYVFAYDAHFGKDPAWFDYQFAETLQYGVTRTRLPAHTHTQRITRPHGELPARVTAVPYRGEITPEMLMRQKMAYQVLARWLFKYIQQQEVCSTCPQP